MRDRRRILVHERGPRLVVETGHPYHRDGWYASLESGQDSIAYAYGRTEREAVRKLERKIEALRVALGQLADVELERVA